MSELSSRQQRMLEFIQCFWKEQGYPPSIRDIVSGCNISSTSVVDYNLKILEKGIYPPPSRGFKGDRATSDQWNRPAHRDHCRWCTYTGAG